MKKILLFLLMNAQLIFCGLRDEIQQLAQEANYQKFCQFLKEKGTNLDQKTLNFFLGEVVKLDTDKPDCRREMIYELLRSGANQCGEHLDLFISSGSLIEGHVKLMCACYIAGYKGSYEQEFSAKDQRSFLDATNIGQKIAENVVNESERRRQVRLEINKLLLKSFAVRL